MTNHFPKRVRLLRPGDFERVFAARRSTSNQYFVLYGDPNDLGHARLGLVVSRRIGSAAARNWWKRLLREAFRLTQAELPAMDLVCIVRTQSPPSLVVLQQALVLLASRLANSVRPTDRRSPEKTP